MPGTSIREGRSVIPFCYRPHGFVGICCLLMGMLWLSGCVEAPQPDEFAGIEIGEAETAPTETSPAAATTDVVTTDLPVADDGWKAATSPLEKSVQSKLLSDDDDVAVDPQPQASVTVPGVATPVTTPPPPAPVVTPGTAGVLQSTSLIPGGIGTPSPSIEATPPTIPAEPKPIAQSQPVAGTKPELKPLEPATPVAVDPTPPSIPEPPRVSEVDKAVEPAPAAPAGLEPTRPRSLIVISPKKLNAKPLPPTPVPPTGEMTPMPPAIILPPSAAADPGALAKANSVIPSPPVPASPAVSTAPPMAPVTPPSSVPAPVEVTPVSTPAVPPEGFVSLFNGQDLTGWSVFDGKSESWKFVDGAATCTAPGGGWLQSDQQYSDFELSFEYRLSPGGNSGVSLRFPGTGNPALEGLEIQLLDDRAEKYQNIQPEQATGSLYFAVAPKERDVAHPAGNWNQCTLVCEGSHLRVTINERLVNEIDLGQLTKTSHGVVQKVSALRSPVGSIAFQSHVSPVDFRNVFLKDLTKSLASGVRWLDLVSGSGDEVPAGAKVTVHYIGHLKIGKKFASSLDKGKPTTVPLKDVIPGWREGIPGMRVGGKRRLIVPPELGYGEKGFKEVIPPNSTLVYEIELLGFERPEAPPAVQSVQTESGTVPR